MGSRVELFEKIRRDHDREGLSIRALARRHGVHRRAVRQALESALPPERKRPESHPAPASGPSRELIDSWLIADRSAPVKQRHTAKRVYERLRDEHGAQVAETTVRDYMRRRRRELGFTVGVLPAGPRSGGDGRGRLGRGEGDHRSRACDRGAVLDAVVLFGRVLCDGV